MKARYHVGGSAGGVGRNLRRAAIVPMLAVALVAVACSGEETTASEATTAADETAASVVTTTATTMPAAEDPAEPDPGAGETDAMPDDPDFMPEAPPAEVTVEGSTMYYKGDIDEVSYERFRKAISEAGDSIETIRIDSPGGDTAAGKKMGRWIHENEVDVVVDGLCFSSCANYIFTAGRNKLITRDSLVGWHGSDQQDELLAQAEGKTLDEYLREVFDSFGDVDPNERFEDFKADNLQIAADERELLEKIGVDRDLLLYGLLPAQYAEYSKAFYVGWTFSIEDMARFGVDNVSYEGDGDYPSERAMEIFADVLVYSLPS